MSVSNISSAMNYVANSYSSTQNDLATALARLGSQKRFQTAGDDLTSFVQTGSLNASATMYEASRDSAQSTLGSINAYDSWASQVITALQDLKSKLGGTQEANQKIAIGAMLTQTYNGVSLNGTGITSTLRMADGSTNAVTSGAASVGTGAMATVAAIDTAINTLKTHVGTAVAWKSAAEATQSFSSAMAQNSRAAASTISGIDEAAEMAKYNAASIQQQAALSMLTQGNVAQSAILRLFQ
jgi:flagellin-like hook-associated protein FlgL